MFNHKWELALFVVIIFVGGSLNGVLGVNSPKFEVLGAEVRQFSTPVLTSHQSPNFNITALTPVAVSTTSKPSVYKPTFYPVWWNSYEQLRRICSCESWGNPSYEPRQFNKDGSILWGHEKDPNGKIIEVKRDVGACQINTLVWGKITKEKGLDVINSFFDNIKMAKYILKVQGLNAWKNSAKCWNK